MCLDASAVEFDVILPDGTVMFTSGSRGRFVRKPRTIQLSVDRANYESKVHLDNFTFALCDNPFAVYVSDELKRLRIRLSSLLPKKRCCMTRRD